jgi:dephospho-CoA kinase
MTGDKLTGILNSQMLLSEKVDRADFVLDTGTDLAATRQQLFLWLDQILD